MTLKKSSLKKYGVITIVSIGLLTLILVVSPFLQNLLKVNNSLPYDVATYVEYKQDQKFLNDKNVLFFKANWCGTCHVAETNILNSLSSIPKTLTIYSLDFENSKNNDLKKKYGVTTQHTFVQVDRNGNLIKKWELSYTVNEILEQLV